ncbi:MAG: SMC-Scp complex subunit ScpB, partial [Minwuia sp.]|nr:SMC-Scp complex subunit ScpB [Minwuia sp.]
MSVDRNHVRIAEALLFAASEPLSLERLKQRLPDDVDPADVMAQLVADYQGRGVAPVQVAGRWMFRTAPDLADALEEERVSERRLSRAAVETLAIIAYHQPTTRAEVEELRGVAVSKGTMDVLMETGWIRPRGRRQTPGRPVTWGTTDEFLIHFGLESLGDLPGIDELKATGLLSA